MTTHTGEVLYTCPHCTKTFNSSANKHSHIKAAHRQQWEENRRGRTLKQSFQTTEFKFNVFNKEPPINNVSHLEGEEESQRFVTMCNDGEGEMFKKCDVTSTFKSVLPS
jgi:uncharacterized C2H2 Zn-finger protein